LCDALGLRPHHHWPRSRSDTENTDKFAPPQVQIPSVQDNCILAGCWMYGYSPSPLRLRNGLSWNARSWRKADILRIE
jgi:hypothetical protein